MLKGLIATACVAVIAAVGYYFWGEYQAHQRAVRLAEIQAERTVCLGYLKDLIVTHAHTKDQVDDCIKRLLIDQSDIDYFNNGGR